MIKYLIRKEKRRFIMIKTVFLDLDDTIFDFLACERVAISNTLRAFSVEPTEEIIKRYSRFNQLQWEALERGEITRDEVITRRFELLFDSLGMKIDPWQVQVYYEDNLSRQHVFTDGALELLTSLRALKKYKLYAATNGLAKVQWRRIRESGIDEYFDGFFISEEMGANKPSSEFFEKCFEKIDGFDKEQAIIIGDSMSSDIKGGANVGMKTCLFNMRNKQISGDLRPDYEIKTLSEVIPLLERL
jgi:2-haloacid dehalogenase